MSLLRREQWSRQGGDKMEQWDGGRLVGVEGSSVEVNGVVTMDIHIGGQTVRVDLVVFRALKVQSLIGLYFFEEI